MHQAEVGRYAALVLGPITSTDRVQGFAGNQTFRLHATSGATAYLKTGPTIPAELHALNIASELDIPAPQVLAADLAVPYLLTAELPGAPTNHTPELIHTAAACLRRLHTVQDPTADWAAALRRPLEVLDDLVPPDLADRLRATLPPFIEQAADVTPALLHGDLHLRHLYTESGRLTGVLDWGDSLYGDPLFDVARLTMTADTDAIVTGYGLRRTSELDRTFTQYRILWSLMALQAERAAGGDWIEPHVRRIAAEVHAGG